MTKFDLLWLAVFGGLSSLACVLMADRVGVTYDESFYLDAGPDGWRNGTCARLTMFGTMPLPVDVQTALPHLRNKLAGELPADPVLSSLRLARAGNLFFWWVLLVHAFLFGRAVGGPWAGRLAVAFLAVDPTWQAHAALATTDVAAAATVVALAYHTLASAHRRLWVRVLLPGTLFGLAVLAKLSGLLYGGLVLVVVDLGLRAAGRNLNPFRSWFCSLPPWGGGLGWGVRAEGGPVTSLLPDAGLTPLPNPPPQGGREQDQATALVRTAVAFVGLLTVRVLIGLTMAVAYCGYDPIPARSVGQLRCIVSGSPTPFEEWRTRNAERFPNFVVAVFFQDWMNSRGGGSFLDGWQPHGVGYYHAAVALMKTPDAILLAGLFALVTRPRACVSLPTVLAVVLFAATFVSKRQIGVRLYFPPLAFAAVGLAVALARDRRGVGVGLVAAAVTAAAAVLVWPHGLTYMNELAGGPSRAHERMADSNVDWGQGLPDLIRWHDDHGRPPTTLWYFGTDPRAGGPRFRVFDLKANPVRSVADAKAAIGATLLAVGHSTACVNPDDPAVKLDVLNWLRDRPVVGRTPTFTIYDLRLE